MVFNVNALVALAFAAALFRVGYVVGGRVSGRWGRVGLAVAGVTLAVPGALMVLYYLHWFDHWVWFYTFRAWRFTDWTAGGLGFGAGLAARWRPARYSGEAASLAAGGAVFVAVMIPHLKPLLAPVRLADFASELKGGVCLQSTEYSCGPAAAVTVMKLFGIAASEREVVRFAFTSRRGTEVWYLARLMRFRGLKSRFIIDPSRIGDPPMPSIAGVRMGELGDFVAVLAKTRSGDFVIGDPLAGRRVVAAEALRREYTFTGFYLQAYE